MKKITKPDVTNTDPKYWEKVLESNNLGAKQLNIEDKPEPGNGKVGFTFDISGSDNDVIRRSDLFTPGMRNYRILKIRTRDREIPEWMMNNQEVQKVLLRAFPRLLSDPKATKKAGRWARVIQLYYRMQMSDSMVAKEMGVKENVVKMILKHIRRVHAGRRTDNSGPRTPDPSPTTGEEVRKTE